MEHKQHICFLQYNLQGGGAERKVCTLANYFVAQGHKVEIGLFGVNTVAYQLDQRVKVTFLRRENYEYKSKAEKRHYSMKAGYLKAACGLMKIFNKKATLKFQKHYDKVNDYTLPIQRYILNRQDAVFISMMVSAYLAVLRVMEPYWGKEIPVPYLVMDCSDPKHNVTPEIQKRRNEMYPKASRVLVMTQGAKAYFSKEIQSKCVIIPNPVRDDLPDAYRGIRRKTVVTYCRLSRQKNLPLLINAFNVFHRDYSDYTLEIYGDGEERESLDALIMGKGLESCARIYPFDPQVHQRIMDCAMFVSSSDWEGWPNSIMEALALGMPVISTDCDFGPRDMITDHVNGLLVPTENTEALANAMAELAENHELAEMLGYNAVKAREIYSPEKIGTQWLELVEEVKKEYV